MLFFLFFLAAIMPAGEKSFGEEVSPAKRTRDEMEIELYLTQDNSIILKASQSRPDIIRLKEKRFRKFVREVPVPELEQKIAESISGK